MVTKFCKEKKGWHFLPYFQEPVMFLMFLSHLYIFYDFFIRLKQTKILSEMKKSGLIIQIILLLVLIHRNITYIIELIQFNELMTNNIQKSTIFFFFFKFHVFF